MQLSTSSCNCPKAWEAATMTVLIVLAVTLVLAAVSRNTAAINCESLKLSNLRRVSARGLQEPVRSCRPCVLTRRFPVHGPNAYERIEKGLSTNQKLCPLISRHLRGELPPHSALMGGQFPIKKDLGAFKNPIFSGVNSLGFLRKNELSLFDGQKTRFTLK